jgi:hypothetical protein
VNSKTNNQCDKFEAVTQSPNMGNGMEGGNVLGIETRPHYTNYLKDSFF